MFARHLCGVHTMPGNYRVTQKNCKQFKKTYKILNYNLGLKSGNCPIILTFNSFYKRLYFFWHPFLTCWGLQRSSVFGKKMNNFPKLCQNEKNLLQKSSHYATREGWLLSGFWNCSQGFGVAPKVLELLPRFWNCSKGFGIAPKVWNCSQDFGVKVKILSNLLWIVL